MNKRSEQRAPKWLLQFFRWFCHPDFVEDIEGDLLERFDSHSKRFASINANWKFALEILYLFRPGIIRPIRLNNTFIHPAMIQHNLKISYRSFIRNKNYFFINLIGFSTGLAAVLLIFLWVKDEKMMDSFHSIDSQLYQVKCNYAFPDGIATWGNTPSLLGKSIEQELPEVESALSISPRGFQLLVENKLHAVNGLFASKKFFELLSFPMVLGDPSHVLQGKQQVAISQSLAIKLFETPQNAIGKTLVGNSYRFTGPFQISGVFKDPPSYSTLNFDVVVNFEQLVEDDPDTENYSDAYARTLLVLSKGTDIENFNQKIAKYLDSKTVWWKDATLFTQKFSEQYLYGKFVEGELVGGRIESVRLFSWIGFFILLVACINFINLATALASKKAKEIGVKKSIGAKRSTLVLQFLVESSLLVSISTLLAVGLSLLLLPAFNDITGKSIVWTVDFSLIASLLALITLTSLLAGSYPALYLSRFKPMAILKNGLSGGKGELGLRKGLVVFQFSLAILFILAVIVIHQQIQFVQGKDLGYDRNNVLRLAVGAGEANPELLVNQLKSLPGVESSAMVATLISNDGSGQIGYNWRGQAADEKSSFHAPMFGYDAIETLGIEVIQGRPFSRDFQDNRFSILLNETALAFMGIEDPIGKVIQKDVGNGKEERKIIGIVKDFHCGSVHEAIKPLVLRFRPRGGNILVRLKKGSEQQTIQEIGDRYAEFYPQNTFEYSFLDESYQAQYEEEQKLASLSSYVGGLTIIISCLGLFGLAAFTVERRKKEIGIRKVVGASAGQLMANLSGDFAKMVLLAILIATPISFALANYWLENFVYKIPLHPGYFLLAGASVLFIAGLTISVQTLQAARINPIECLKDE